MQLGEIRQLLNDYESSWSISRLILGDSVAIIKIKDFLREFEYQHDTYKLTPHDIYTLISLINIESDISFINDLKLKFNNNLLLSIFNKLQYAEILSENNFKAVCSLKLETRIFINRVLSPNFEISADLAEFTLEQAKAHDGNSAELYTLEKILKITGRKRLINKPFLNYLTNNNNDFHLVLEGLQAFQEAHAINTENLARIINLEPDLLHYFAEFITVTHQAGIVADSELCERAETCGYPSIVNELLSILVTNSNKIVIDKNIVLALFEKNLWSLLDYARLLHTLQNNELLTQTTFDYIYKNNSASLIYLLRIVSAHGMLKNNHDLLTQLFSLSQNNMKRLNTILDTLLEKQLLNHHSLNAALKRITEKIPAPAESNVTLPPTKDRSSIILDSDTQIYLKPNEHPSMGSYGEVRKGYSSSTANSPTFAVKKLVGDKDDIKPIDAARREAKYNRLLGRNGLFYKTGTQYFVAYDWQSGLPASSKNAIYKMPFINRIEALIYGINDVNTLHQHFRIHGDIKPDNFILDSGSNKLKLIDFGGCHKQASEKSFEFTDEYRDNMTHGKDFPGDIFSLGFATAELFPELFQVYFKPTQHISVHKVFCTPLDSAIIRLVTSMTLPISAERCTSKDALEFCHYLVKNHDKLDMQSIEKIASETIDHTVTTLEDVLRHAPKRG